MKLCLNLGCGSKPKPSTDGERWVNLDSQALPGVDVVRDICRGLPFADSTFDHILLDNVLEHFSPDDAVFVINEIGRCLKISGTAEIIIPHAHSQGAWQDPTHKCLMPDTEVLTEEGFRLIKTIPVGTRVLGFDLTTHETAWVDVEEIISEPYDGLLYEFTGQRMHLAVTPEHRLCVDAMWQGARRARSGRYEFALMRAADVATRAHTLRGLATIPRWQGKEAQWFDLPMPTAHAPKGKPWRPVRYPMEAFCRFLGWYLAEGSACRTTNGYMYIITLSQSITSPHRPVMENVVQSLGYRPQWSGLNLRFQHRELCLWLKTLGHSHTKHIPVQFKNLPCSCLAALLEGLIGGDGYDTQWGWAFDSTSPQLADDVQEIALKCGYRASCCLDRRGPVGFAKTPYAVHRVRIARSGRAVYYPRPVTHAYTGQVVCLRLSKFHIFLARSGGHCLWTGNSSWVPRSVLYWSRNRTPYGGRFVGITANLVEVETKVYGNMNEEAFIRFVVRREEEK